MLLVKLYIYQNFRALAYLHALGICHRDIKPQNILRLNNKYLLADFGISKVIRNNDEEIAKDDDIVGTIAYMSPELHHNH